MADELANWTCIIGEIDRRALPTGSDAPMRQAVADAYRALTGRDPEFLFSGWGDPLSERYRAVVENRDPNPLVLRDELMEMLIPVEAFIASDLPADGECTRCNGEGCEACDAHFLGDSVGGESSE